MFWVQLRSMNFREIQQDHKISADHKSHIFNLTKETEDMWKWLSNTKIYK